MQFPEGDTLGVVFSFLASYKLLQGAFFAVCKEWHRVLCELPHAWGDQLDLSFTRYIPHSKFAWHRVTVCLACRGALKTHCRCTES